ncbi:hypothetical protein HaLaN_22207 [Haematococcus lacustris]|uniref:Uncharacterized protein n=1 Tax=Haematococcus lacustris TaxID=44745 RepID=A0A699ZP13_HAELA|nr:hypothetical protein HaLaN_22207 [Haematococcus lacustris]
MDGRRALVPLWAVLAEAGMAGNDSALCVKVLGASRSQRPEELPALLSVPDQLASRVQVVPNLPYAHFYAAIAQSAALVPAIIDSSPSLTSPAQSNHLGRLSVNRSEYSSKRFTSSVITALICETPLLTSSVEEQRLLSSVQQPGGMGWSSCSRAAGP